MTVEKKVLLECLQLYKDFPCLWDNRILLYNNKEAREQAYEVLLEKYRQSQEDATMPELKRKIENMRTTYRRERRKVLLSKMKNSSKEYTPQLWYYNNMTFLNDVLDFSNLEQQIHENGNVSDDDTTLKEEFNEDIDHISSSSKRLKTPQSSVKKRRISTIYLDQHDSDDNNVIDQDDEESHIDQIHEQSNQHFRKHYKISEAESFGTTVGLQLRELDLMQKIHAEKLISDVIYNARLGRLSYNSSLNID